MNNYALPEASWLSYEEIRQLQQELTLEELVKKAKHLCQTHYGNTVWIRGLLEISNQCSCDCLYCGIRKSNGKVRRYTMSAVEITETVRHAFHAGFRTFVLQSGEQAFSVAELCSIAENIKKITGTEGALTLSCGILSKQEFKDLRSAGTDRYLLRFETSSSKLHAYLRDGFTLQERLQALYSLKELGYELGSGYMVGLPEETQTIRNRNILLCEDLKLDMVGIGPFIPHQNTPLRKASSGTSDLVREAVALVRISLPQANIPATTAAATLNRDLQRQLLQGGANVLMLNITPSKYRENYALYPGKANLAQDIPLFTRCSQFKAPKGSRADFSRGNSLSYDT